MLCSRPETGLLRSAPSRRGSRPLRSPGERSPDYDERVLKRFQAEREDGERFATWAARASEEALS